MGIFVVKEICQKVGKRCCKTRGLEIKVLQKVGFNKKGVRDMSEKIANIIGTVFIVGGAISGACLGNISVIGCVIDSLIFIGIGIGPMIIDYVRKRGVKE